MRLIAILNINLKSSNSFQIPNKIEPAMTPIIASTAGLNLHKLQKLILIFKNLININISFNIFQKYLQILKYIHNNFINLPLLPLFYT